MAELLQLADGVSVPKPEDDVQLRYCPEAAQDVVDFFSLLCHGQNEWAGKPFVLLPWQLEAIRQFYGIQVQEEEGFWVRYRRFLYAETPKKNGKSELAAGLGPMGSGCPMLGFLLRIKTMRISSTRRPNTWWSTAAWDSPLISR